MLTPTLSTKPREPTSMLWRESRLSRLATLLSHPPYRYQATVWQDQSPLRLILKARQVGVSTAVVAEALDAAYTEPDTLCLFVSRNLDAAIHLLGYAYRMMRPLGLEGTLEKRNETELALTNGSRLKSLPASRDTGRGFDATRVYLDEHAFQPWEEDIFEAVAPTVARGGSITALSTANGRSNLFYRLWAGMEGGE